MKKANVQNKKWIKPLSVFLYIISITMISIGTVGNIIIKSNSFEGSESKNSNLTKTVSTKELMTSFQKIDEKRQAEERAKAEAEAKRRLAAELSVVTAPKSEIQQYAHDLVVGVYGWSESDFTALVKLWNRESGWRPNARNSSSGACGIPQALPCSKISNAYGDLSWQSQVKWGLDYIKRRYTTPAGAWEHSERKGWY